MEFHGLNVGVLRCGTATVRLMRSRSDEKEDKFHRHKSPHFLLPLDPGFHSDAWRFFDSGSGQLIFSPAGTDHRDCMARLHGRFAIITVDDPSILKSGLLDFSTADLPIAVAKMAHRTVILALIGCHSSHREIEALAIEMFRQLAKADKPSATATAGAAARALLQAEPHKSLSEVARLLNTDVRALAAIQRKTKQTPLQTWRSWNRVNAAADALRTQVSAIADVAADLGYSDQSHLTRRFRRFFRLTPARYRQLFEQNQFYAPDALASRKCGFQSAFAKIWEQPPAAGESRPS